jgi:hypothetical protein
VLLVSVGFAGRVDRATAPQAALLEAHADQARMDAHRAKVGADGGPLQGRYNHYLVLAVGRLYTPDSLKKAYRAASRLFHPDKATGSADAFQPVPIRFRRTFLHPLVCA